MTLNATIIRNPPYAYQTTTTHDNMLSLQLTLTRHRPPQPSLYAQRNMYLNKGGEKKGRGERRVALCIYGCTTQPYTIVLKNYRNPNNSTQRST